VGRLGELRRHDCRAVFEQRYDAVRMARAYLDVYRRVAHTEEGQWRSPSTWTYEPLLRAVSGRR